MKYDVFISYRRDGGDTLSQLIYDRLTRRGYRVFLDIESLNSGKFNEKLLEVIDECKDIIIVLPPNGLDRCHNEGDWVLRELEHAMELKKNIVPVLMKNFEWPEDIPESIKEIRNYNGIVDNKDYFDAVIDKLTTLLKSKPVVGGNFFKKVGEKKLSFNEKMKKRKKLIAGIVVLLLVCVGAIGIRKYTEKQKLLEAQNQVKITLTPDEEMSASEYYDAVEIVKKRFEILSEGYALDFEEDKGKVTVLLPLDVFHGIDVQSILQCYITRPVEIYLSESDKAQEEDYFFHIERDDIESMEVVPEIPIEVDFSSYHIEGVENEEDYQYYALEVNDETAKAAKEWMEEKGWESYKLFQDCEEFGLQWFYYLPGIFEDNNMLYFMDSFQYENIFNLVQYNYSNETFSKPFSFSIELPVRWENENDENTAFGENQCNHDELTGKVARIDYTTYETEFSEGEYQDTVKCFKARLDSLGTPYALGYDVSNPYNICVKINPDYMNEIVFGYMGDRNKIGVRSRFNDIMDEYYIEKAEVKEKDDGTFSLELTPTETWRNLYKEKVAEEVGADEEVCLCLSAYPDIPLDRASFSEVYNGETFVFEGLSSFELKEVDKETRFMYDFLVSLTRMDMPFSYNAKAIYADDDLQMELIVPDSTISDQVKEEWTAALDTINEIKTYEIKVDSIGQQVSLKIVSKEADSYEENVNTIFKKIYDVCRIGTGDVRSILINFYEETDTNQTKNTNFTLLNSDIAKKVQLTAYYYYQESKERMDEFDRIFNEDEFYKQLYVDEYSMDDGKITFQ